jgi:hypothetical protein
VDKKQKEGGMKRVMYTIIGGLLVIGLIGCTHAFKKNPRPTVVVDTSKVKMSKKAKVVITGTDFKSGQEVNLLFTAADGVKSDIGYALKPKPVANHTGAWTTTWSCGRYIKKKLIKEGTYTITVTDTEYNPIADASVEFYAEKKTK